MKRLTIEDIAKEMGYSKSTISLALRNSDKVRPETKNKILEIVRKYNYFPDYNAQRLATGKTGIIAILSTRFATPFATALILAIENLIYKNLLSNDALFYNKLQFYPTFNLIEKRHEIIQKILYSNIADAVILITVPLEKKFIKEFKIANKPLIFIENKYPEAHSIRCDNFYGVAISLDYLKNKGRKNIVYVVGAQKPLKGEDINIAAIERFEGIKEWNKKQNLELRDENIIFSGDYSFEEGRKFADKIINLKADAVFCAAGDLVAAGILHRFLEKRIKVPDDIALIGYDNQLISRSSFPGITTVDQKLEDIGRMAYEIAIDAINNNLKEEKHITIKPELILRDTA